MVERLFRPLRGAIARKETILPAAVNARHGRLHAKLAQDEGHLMLGELLRGFCDTLERLGAGPRAAADVVDAVAEGLRALPNPGAPTAGVPVLRRRKSALFALNTARTHVAHARDASLPPEDISAAWA